MLQSDNRELGNSKVKLRWVGWWVGDKVDLVHCPFSIIVKNDLLKYYD